MPKFDFLMHAMLGLAASHLSLCNTTEFSSQALTHRVHAIRLFDQRLSKPCVSKAEADARYATIMALTFQSSYMREGMIEFMIMLRGCTVVSHTVIPVLEESLFSGFTAESHTERVLSLQQNDPVDALLGDVWDAALASVNNLRPICNSVLEVRYLSILGRILKLSRTSPVEGFTEICLAYMIFGETSEVEFNHFTDPSNHAAQIIMAHFFVIEYILAAIALKPIIDSFPFRRVIIANWTKEISKKLPSGYEEYIRWPLEFAELCHREHGP
ncbi:Zn(2)-C6 fungal-type domain-containing protein [Fusarium sp. LHS14.1]|nr:Zn(2)-C6 fungal-type domain-containing protein [Fusarium sp. LHS14.1]